MGPEPPGGGDFGQHCLDKVTWPTWSSSLLVRAAVGVSQQVTGPPLCHRATISSVTGAPPALDTLQRLSHSQAGVQPGERGMVLNHSQIFPHCSSVQGRHEASQNCTENRPLPPPQIKEQNVGASPSCWCQQGFHRRQRTLDRPFPCLADVTC